MLDGLCDEGSRLDQIMRLGFKRIDEAIDRVIYSHCGGAVPPCEYLSLTSAEAQRLHNFRMSKMAEEAVFGIASFAPERTEQYSDLKLDQWSEEVLSKSDRPRYEFDRLTPHSEIIDNDY